MMFLFNLTTFSLLKDDGWVHNRDSVTMEVSFDDPTRSIVFKNLIDTLVCYKLCNCLT